MENTFPRLGTEKEAVQKRAFFLCLPIGASRCNGRISYPLSTRFAPLLLTPCKYRSRVPCLDSTAGSLLLYLIIEVFNCPVIDNTNSPSAWPTTHESHDLRHSGGIGPRPGMYCYKPIGEQILQYSSGGGAVHCLQGSSQLHGGVLHTSQRTMNESNADIIAFFANLASEASA